MKAGDKLSTTTESATKAQDRHKVRLVSINVHVHTVHRTTEYTGVAWYPLKNINMVIKLFNPCGNANR